MRKILVVALTSIALTAGAADFDVSGTVEVGGRGHAQAVVWLDAPGASPRADQRRPVMDQRNLQFAPRVLAVQVGTTVDFPNNDRVFHNVFSFKDGKRFDLGLYPIGAVKPATFDRPGISRLFCNIHPKMAAYIVAVDSPYFAVSGDAGAFTIKGVPPGTYTYRAWRSGGPEISGSVVIDGTQPLQVRWP